MVCDLGYPFLALIVKDGEFWGVFESNDYAKREEKHCYIDITQEHRDKLEELEKGFKIKEVFEGISWETTPLDIAKQISKSVAKRAVAAKVDGELWDLLRPLEANAQLEILDFESKEAQQVLWRSSALVLAEACQGYFGSVIVDVGLSKAGFYCDMTGPQQPGHGVSQTHYKPLEELVKQAVLEKQPFQRLVANRDELKEIFADNPYKQRIINEKMSHDSKAVVYRYAQAVEIWSEPLLPSSEKIAAFALLNNSASYFLGDAKNDSLQRIHGISFPDKKRMAEHKKLLEEAARRDHRKIGREQELFFFHELSPGSAFFLPHGTRIYNKLMQFIRGKYWEHGFEEVVTPNMFNTELWKQSGHWQNYQDNMFKLNVDQQEFALKPMNCPGHCLMFGMRSRSYRELPLRFADFGVLHRNEASGALAGLARVRRFQQDDAHIFCLQGQVKSEISLAFLMLRHVYEVFGFQFKLKLSTRPDNFVGDIEVWDQAEQQLQEALDEFGYPWELNPGDGAFYGPKIDIVICDALGRDQQCATIQLDFQLPKRFQLQVLGVDASGKPEQPVIIHRAVLGSLERMMAMLIEHYAGKWPFWLSPRQVIVVPTSNADHTHVEQVKQQIHKAGFYVDADVSGDTLNKKIRNAELAQYNFICVVGEQEQLHGCVNVRSRDDASAKGRGQMLKIGAFIDQLNQLNSISN
ncbi:threonyl-tRNA synthetase [Coemansia sp. RSA 989]|nr:threonyl-tRNA synthetase [Coemansia sp. RSA 989]